MSGWELLNEEELLNCPPWVRVTAQTLRLEDGETVIAIGAVREHLIPALLFGLSGKPRWFFAFLGGLLSSGLLETVRQQAGDGPPVGWS